MKKILLVCANGMSTANLVAKMKKYIEEKGYEYEVSAVSIANAPGIIEGVDVCLIGPQVRFNLSKIQAMNPNITVEPVDMSAFGLMDGAKVVEQARSIIGD